MKSVRHLTLVLLTFGLLLGAFDANGQNLVMAKAYYSRAQKEYEKENYEVTLQLIEKAKEELGNSTTVDLIYLEAKTRFQFDNDINECKNLLNQFLNTASDDDSRIREVADLVVEIEVSDDFDAAGNRKEPRRKIDKAALKGLVGSWAFTFKTPMGETKGKMTIDSNDDVISGVLKYDDGSADDKMEKIEFEADKLSFAFSIKAGEEVFEIVVTGFIADGKYLAEAKVPELDITFDFFATKNK